MTFMVVLFLSWNVITYYFLTYNTQQPRKENVAKNDFMINAKSRLDYIALEVKKQIATNEALLRDLLYHQKDEAGMNGTGKLSWRFTEAMKIQYEEQPESLATPPAA